MISTNHDEIFATAFASPDNLSIKQPDINVNNIIRDYYTVTPATFALTKSLLWEMECRKAAAPNKYIPTVVKAGSVEKFPSFHEGHCEYFTRISDQRCWKDPSKYVKVIEHVKLDNRKQVVTFIGAEAYVTPDGRHIVAGKDQPIFHVEHGVVGDDESQPLNSWRIVHFTKGQDDLDMREAFASRSKNKFLPEYVEIYIKKDLGVSLARKED
jgi:hypothetical protein